MDNKQFDIICRKLDKIQHMLTISLKALHLLPVTEEEEKKIQIAQRKNISQTKKVNEDLNAMTGKSSEEEESLNMHSIMDMNTKELYDGIIGDDIIGGNKL